jgi:hypothetical protein
MNPDNKDTQAALEQYKAYIVDLGNFGTRYSRAHSLYFSLLGATIAVLGLTDSGKLLGGPLRGHVVWIVAAFGIGLCLLWLATANYYSAAFAAKFKVLRELEKSLPVQPYTMETRLLGLRVDQEEPPAGKRRALISIEQLIPVVFILLIVALAVLAGK